MQFWKSFDVRHPWFRPVWRRVVAVVACWAWALFEFFYASVVFGSVFVASGAYLFYQFFIVYDPADYEPKE